MVNHWKLDKRIDKTVLFLQKYHWDENGLNVEYLDESSTIRINITFPTRVEMFCFKFVEQSVFSEDDSYQLIKAASCDGPINPFFYQTLSQEDVKSLHLYINPWEEREAMIKYTMHDHDTWITVVSSVLPEVLITDTI